jgi:hypothetical protein
MPNRAVADLSFGVQSAKGTAATAAYRVFLSGGGLSPRRRVDVLSGRHSTGFPERLGWAERYVDGDPEIFARPEPLGLILYAALGAKSVSGASDPWTHTITPAATVPWITFWRMVGEGAVIEQFVDCRIAKLRIRSANGHPIRVEMQVLGRTARRRTANVATAVTVTAPFLHTHGVGALQVNGVPVKAISEVDVLIDNGFVARPGPLGTGWDVVGGAERSITARVRGRVTDAQRYFAFHYGATNPADNTAAAQDPETGGALDFLWTLSASRSLRLQIPSVAPAEFGGYEASPEHGPMVEERTYHALRGGSAAITATLRNGVSSY